MLRLGKKLDGYYNDKIARSNRGRARTSATGAGRKHANLGYRPGQASISDLRSHKRRARLAGQIAIQDELFDLDLSQFDPEIWLYRTDLTTFRDTTTKLRGYPSGFAQQSPYAYVPNAYDWDWAYDWYQDDDERAHCYLHVGDYESDYEYKSGWSSGSDPDPEPSAAAWRDLWVDGHVYDAEGRDMPDPMYDGWSCHNHDYYDLDYLDDLYNPLLEREGRASPVTIEAHEERNVERHRAGERYFRQHGRTAVKTLDAPSRARLQARAEQAR